MKISLTPLLLALLALMPYLVGAQQAAPWDSLFRSIFQFFNYINPFWWLYNILFGSDLSCSDYTVDDPDISCDCEVVLNTFLILITGANVRMTCTAHGSGGMVASVPVSGGTFYIEVTATFVVVLTFVLYQPDENDLANLDYLGGCWNLSGGSSDQICFEYSGGLLEQEFDFDKCAISTEDGDCACTICEGGELVTYNCDGVGGSTLSSDGMCVNPFLFDDSPSMVSMNNFMLGISDFLGSEENPSS